MSLNVCPAAIIAAPVEVVWEMAQPANLSKWIDGRIERIEPEGPMAIGQTIYVTSRGFGRNWHATLTVEKVLPERHQFGMYGVFPFGMRMHEHLSCVAVDAKSCRVQYG
ncbi:MAG: SRPBCC family protein [Ktedonobacteraceae bacterium]